jgi:hypothetical protein
MKDIPYRQEKYTNEDVVILNNKGVIVQLLKYILFIAAVVGQLIGMVLLFVDQKKAVLFFIVYGVALGLLLMLLIVERRKEKKEDDERDYRDY